jgi:hypothetical protein
MRALRTSIGRWDHLDFEAGEWVIPEENAKNGKPHIVYLSTQVAEMFRELKALAGDSELVMPGRSSLRKPFVADALNKALDGLTFDMDPLTIHDLRRTGATLLTERGFNKDVIEKALSHEPVGIRAVYVIAEFAEQRKQMLQWWADYVDTIVNESKIIVLTSESPRFSIEGQPAAMSQRRRILSILAVLYAMMRATSACHSHNSHCQQANSSKHGGLRFFFFRTGLTHYT